MIKKFKQMSDLRGRSVKLFRSSDKTGTASYWTNLDPEHKHEAEAFFEIMLFGYDWKQNQIYIRYPNTDYFVETLGGWNSEHGTMKSGRGKNPWNSPYKQKFELFCHDKNLMFKEYEHNFLTEVASSDFGSSWTPKRPAVYVNKSELDIAFNMQYLALPEDVMTIMYSYKTEDSSTRFLIFCPTYNFTYNNHQVWEIKEDRACKQLTVKDFQRYKDGGTTYIAVEEDPTGFYFPTSFSKGLVATYGGKPIVETTEEERALLVEILGIEIDKSN